MDERIESKEPPTRRIRTPGSETRRIDPGDLPDALGAERVDTTAEVRGSTPATLAAREELLRRLRSTGGRPGLEGATLRRQVSFTREDWEELERIADKLAETDGVNTTPGQVASALVHRLVAPRK